MSEEHVHSLRLLCSLFHSTEFLHKLFPKPKVEAEYEKIPLSQDIWASTWTSDIVQVILLLLIVFSERHPLKREDSQPDITSCGIHSGVTHTHAGELRCSENIRGAWIRPNGNLL